MGKSYGCAIPHSQSLSRIAVTHGDTNIPGTVSIDKWLSVVRAIGKEAPALIDYGTVAREDNSHLLTAEQFWHHRKWDIGDEVTEMIDMDNVCINVRSLAHRMANVNALQYCGIYGGAQFMQCNTASQVCTYWGKDIAPMKG